MAKALVMVGPNVTVVAKVSEEGPNLPYRTKREREFVNRLVRAASEKEKRDSLIQEFEEGGRRVKFLATCKNDGTQPKLMLLVPGVDMLPIPATWPRVLNQLDDMVEDRIKVVVYTYINSTFVVLPFETGAQRVAVLQQLVEEKERTATMSQDRLLEELINNSLKEKAEEIAKEEEEKKKEY